MLQDVKTAVEEHRKDDIIDNAVALGGALTFCSLIKVEIS